MNNKWVKKIAAVSVLSTLFYASAAFALTVPTIPCGNPRQVPCTICHLVQLGSNLVDFLTQLALALGVIFVLYGAYVIMTAGASPGNLEKGKKIIYSVIIGVVVMLVAWVGIDTIFKVLTDGSLGPWNEIDCSKFNL